MSPLAVVAIRAQPVLRKGHPDIQRINDPVVRDAGEGIVLHLVVAVVVLRGSRNDLDDERHIGRQYR
jgi:hypothetical protein